MAEVIILPIDGWAIELTKVSGKDGLEHANKILKVVIENEKIRLMGKGIEYTELLD